jgi:hypothetical protein
LKVAK